MKIEIADYSGFCFGVKKAVEMTYKTIFDSKGKNNIYSCGPIIHNDNVTFELVEMGLKIVQSLDEVPENSILIVRSHGEGKKFYDTAAKKNLEIIDATCPFVERIHNIVNSYKYDETIVVVGDFIDRDRKSVV